MMIGAKLSLRLTTLQCLPKNMKETCLPVQHTKGLCPASSSAPDADQGHHTTSAALQPQSEAQVSLQVFMCYLQQGWKRLLHGLA